MAKPIWHSDFQHATGCCTRFLSTGSTFGPWICTGLVVGHSDIGGRGWFACWKLLWEIHYTWRFDKWWIFHCHVWWTGGIFSGPSPSGAGPSIVFWGVWRLPAGSLICGVARHLDGGSGWGLLSIPFHHSFLSHATWKLKFAGFLEHFSVEMDVNGWPWWGSHRPDMCRARVSLLRWLGMAASCWRRWWNMSMKGTKYLMLGW